MHSSAKWIWTPHDDGSRNFTVCFRRAFELLDKPQEAFLDISADSRYVLYINNQRVGQGPARSWNHLKQYDRYEISRYLTDETNIIAVQVVRWGITNGFYAGGPGGFIASLTLDGSESPEWVTDDLWKTAIHPAYEQHVPRLAWGQAFTEHYDACFELGDWRDLAFDDSSWSKADVIGPIGTEPWISMQSREIPMLTEEPRYPVRVFDECVVQPPKYTLSFDLWPILQEPGMSEKHKMVVLEFESDHDSELIMIRMNATHNLDTFEHMRFNGNDVAFQGDRATFPIKAGSNLLVMQFRHEHQSQPSWVFETKADIRYHSPLDKKSAMAFYAAESEEDEIFSKLWNAVSVNDVPSGLRDLGSDVVYTDVFALSNTRKTIATDEYVKIDSRHAMCSANSEYAVVHPSEEGDVEFLLDFGEEIVGFINFEVDAPLGTVIDFLCFEAIVDGERKWTDNLNNTLRYTTKDGWQHFHSTVRRGFRYAQVTIRGASRPVRVREILCLHNTYPVLGEGEFRSSDELLNRIWEIGRRTTRLCMEDTFVDCPAYEQTFWVGDSRNEALAAYAAFGDTALTRWCMKLASQSLWRSPMVENAVPAGHAGIIPNWSMFWVLACEEYYRYTFDKDFVTEILPFILQQARFMLSRKQENGLWQYPGWNMVDWAAMDCPRDGFVTHENALLVETLRRAANLAEAVNNPDAAKLRTEAESLKQAINEHLWNDEKRAYVDSIYANGTLSPVFSQQTQTMIYLCDCATPERKKYVEQYVKDVPEGWVNVGSPWMMWFSFEALAKKGDYSQILDWMRRYWGEMVEYGATTCWETYASWAAGRWTPTRSWCHAWSAAPVFFLSNYQLGVRMIDSGDGKVEIAPIPGDLKWAKGRVPTVYGTITVSWRIRDGIFDLNVLLPGGLKADLRVPDGYEPGDVLLRTSEITTSP